MASAFSLLNLDKTDLSVEYRKNKLYARVVNFYNQHGYFPDLKEPKSFNEKILWLRFFDTDKVNKNLIKYCKNKILHREYVERKYSSDILVPLLKTYNSIDDINLNDLPNEFVIKLSVGSKRHVIVNDKLTLNWEDVVKNIKRMQIVEKWGIQKTYLDKNSKEQELPKKILILKNLRLENEQPYEYKFWCFDGEPKIIEVTQGKLNDELSSKLSAASMYDINWNKLPFRKNKDTENRDEKKPNSFNKMKEVAISLSKDFKFARVDLYEYNENIYFSEFGFYPCGCVTAFTPPEADFEVGKLLDISSKLIN